MIVELVGPPGAGKTSLLPALSEQLPASRAVDMKELRAGSRSRVWGRRAVAAARNPALTVATSRLYGFGRTRTSRTLTIATRDVHMRRLAARRGCWLVDEGPLHTVLWAAVAVDASADLSPAIRRLRLPDVVLRVSVAPEVAASRITGRTYSIVRGMTFEEVCGVVDRYERLADRFLARLPCPLVEIDHPGQLVTAAHEIERAASSHPGHDDRG